MDTPTKSFEVEIDGTMETIEYKTDLTYGEVQEIKKKTYKSKNPFDVEFDGELYQRLIMERTVVKAPFDPKDYTAIYKLPNDVINKILVELMETYPLERFFLPMSKMLKTTDTTQ